MFATDFLSALIVVSLTFTKGAFGDQDSPCPATFQYMYDNGLDYGRIQVDTFEGDKLLLEVEISVGNRVTGKIGEITLPEDSINNIKNYMQRRPIIFNLYFPRWEGTRPLITNILVNGVSICSGPGISLNSALVVTKISLYYTLSVRHISVPRRPNDGNHWPNDGNHRPNDGNHRPNDGNHRMPVPFQDDEFIYPKQGYDSPERPPTNPPKYESNYLVLSPVSSPRRKMNVNSPNTYDENPFLNGLPSPSNTRDKGLNRDDDDFTNYKPATPPRRFYPNSITTERSIEIRPPFPYKPSNDLPIGTNAPDIVKDEILSEQPFGSMCGKTAVTNTLIVNGNSIPKGAFPWLVALFLVEADGPRYKCCGSLISDKHVVTAAHCVHTEGEPLQPSDLFIVMGKVNLQDWRSTYGQSAQAIHVHPQYGSSNDSDIAVLELGEKVQFTDYIRPLCIWSGDTNLRTVVDKQGIVVGWGNDENDVLITTQPKLTNMPIVSQEQCLRSDDQFFNIVSNKTFCAGFRNGYGPCRGHSGSAFAMQVEGRWMLKGILSRSISGPERRACDLKKYIVFTDASKFTRWLLTFIK